MGAKVYNIPLSCSFVSVLAERFLEEYKNNPLELCDVVFLMPNRRSCLSLKQAFLNANGLKPFLLPQIVPVQDVDEDEIFFDVDSKLLSSLPSAISNEERLFLFARLIASKHESYGIKDISFAQSLSLAADLGKLIDGVYNESLSFDALDNIVPEQYAAHWQETLKFLKIVTQFWPEILDERGVVDGVKRRNILLSLEAKNWREKNSSKRIVAAGISLAFEGLKEIVKTVANMKNGEVFIYGLDRFLSDEDFEKVEATHPQYEKKKILELLELKREDVIDVVRSQDVLREKLVSEVMRPAETTLKWRNLSIFEDKDKAFENLHLITAENQFEEAMSVALVMRQTLEIKGKTAALVTTDRNLARAVSNMLKCFGIDIDDSAGIPLHLCPIGIYLRQILDVLDEAFSQNSMAALLKNPYVHLGGDVKELRKKVRAEEFLRRKPKFKQSGKEETDENEVLPTLLEEAFCEIKELYSSEKVSFKALLKAHLKLAEKLSQSDKQEGAEVLWRGDDGRACAAFLGKLIDKAEIVGEVLAREYAGIITALLATQTVRRTYGGHPRLKILGPIEARFNRFDVIIAGSFNEGVWPKANKADPFMSRSMKKTFGLPPDERAIGVLADDLSALMCAPEVYLTRAERVGGVPMGPSRYLLRLETVMKACGYEDLDLEDLFYVKLAQKLQEPDKRQKIEPPEPRPPLSARPRKFSATSIATLMTDPYEIYAKYILKLPVLKDLDEGVGQTDYGTIVHDSLEEFTKTYDKAFEIKDAFEFLMNIGNRQFEKYPLEPKQKAFFKARFEKTAEWFCAIEKDQRDKIFKSVCEVWGKMTLKVPAGDVVLEARADRVDERKDGTYEIIDYKTGRAPSLAEMNSGYAPQLVVEAMIAQNGGFESNGVKLAAKEVSRLAYWRMGEKVVGQEKDVDLLVEKTEKQISELLRAFDDEKTPYLARPNPKHMPKYSDYEHLARVKEWASGDDKNE
ncbi:MAG: PD-(D/E)XK nuclease family protein [Alphaproteobacteria bacterium]|nr:PD-(D/E)XK nuclease family protein [Alphaproteobacteria bacterium]